MQGRNDFQQTGYGGPCPPPNRGKHRYRFRRFATDLDSLQANPNEGHSAMQCSKKRLTAIHAAISRAIDVARFRYLTGALVAATCFIEPSPCLAQHDANDRQTVAVSGRGEVRRAPDTVEITVGVTSEAKSAGKALDENNAATDALIESIRRHGVDQRDIQTTNIAVSPKYEQPREQVARREIVGYTVTNQLRVRMQDVSKLEVTRHRRRGDHCSHMQPASPCGWHGIRCDRAKAKAESSRSGR